MEKLFAVMKLNKKVHFGTISNAQELTTVLHTDTLFKDEKEALEYIENVESLELLIIQPVYITAIKK